MSEKLYDLKVPMNTFGIGTASVTKSQAQSILAQCQQIIDTPEPRQWRDGDVVEPLCAGNFSIRLGGEWYWIHDGDKIALEPRFFTDGMYRGNVIDWIKSGLSLWG